MTELDARVPVGFRNPPHSTDSEQALIGAILVNNEAFHQVSGFLRGEHFYDAVHRRMFDHIASAIGEGRRVDHVLMATAFEDDPELIQLDGGGKHYLAAISRSAEAIINAEDYGRHVHQLAIRRGLIRACEDAANQAYDVSYGPKVNGQLTHLRETLAFLEKEQATGPRGPALLTAVDFVAGYRPARPLIKAWDTKPGWLYSFTAPTGYAKTAMALGEAFNQALAGRTIVYLAGENPDDVRARTVLMKDRLGIADLPDTLRFVDRTFHMSDTMEFLREQIEETGGADLIFVDTSPAFQAVSGAVEENSNTEQLRWAMVLRQMTKFKGNPAVIALCHPPKRPQSIEESIPRGGGSFLAEVDGNYVSWLKTDDGERKFFDFTWTGKFRGSFEPVSYVVEIGTCDALADPDGNMVRTVWAHAADEQQMDKAAREQAETEDALMTAMANYPNKSMAAWATLLGWQKWNVQRVMKRLATDKLVQMKRGRYQLTGAGKEEAKRADEAIRRAAE